MLFNSVEYLIFLPLVVALFWLLKPALRPGLLVAASYYFYMSWFAPYGLLIASLTALNYFVGLAIEQNRAHAWKGRVAFLFGTAANLGGLAFFKYANFLGDNLSILSHRFGGASSFNLHWQILLPLGISFFAFEFIHYLVDVYAGNAALRNPMRFALFGAFFPSQIAGPIKRYENFDEQITASKLFSPNSFQQGIWLILEGLFKKVVLGDNLSVLVQQGFSSVQLLSPLDAWLTVICFAFQIYYDFSGYTDIGRGSALLLNIHLPENFEKPYLSSSLIEFWRRWHISLSTWLRDYLYKPLGGSRGGMVGQLRNLIITMLLGGLWHGASWHFVAWGLFHGIGLSANHLGRRANRGIESGNVLSKLPGIALTFVFVCLGWVLFRADSFEQALLMYGHMFEFHSDCLATGFLFKAITDSVLPAGLVFYMLWQTAKLAGKTDDGLIRIPGLKSTPGLKFVAAFGLAIMIFGLASKQSNPFIYFQF